MAPEIVFQTPVGYFFLCLLTGLVFSGIFYFRTTTFNKNQKVLLAIIRGALVTTIAFLLLNPLLKTINSIILKPKVVLVLDNSTSMLSAGKKNAEELLNSIKALSKSLTDKGFEMEVNTLDGTTLANDIDFNTQIFNQKKTNFSNSISEIENNYEGQNLTDLILVSDGIINDGITPKLRNANFRIHTVGFGDSTIKKDVRIYGLTANKLAYLGNKFTVSADISAFEFSGKTTSVSIKNGAGKILNKQNITFKSKDDFQTINFEIQADKIGKQRYTVEIASLEGEFTTKNNRRDFVIEVINGKEKVLFFAFAPHPDIKALKDIIEKNDLFEVKVEILQSMEPSKIGLEPFDILILHQVPDVYGSSAGIVSTLLAKQKPTFFFVGGKTNLPTFNGMQNVMGVSSDLNRLDKANAYINTSFNRFTIDEQFKDVIEKLPPLSLPFGDYKNQVGSETILFQSLSNIKTPRPLLALNLNGPRKSAVWVGEGIFQWRMEEFALSGAHFYVDEVFTKTLQLISIKEDKNKLRVYPLSDTYGIDEKVSFEAEAYNDIFEKIYDQKVTLNIIDEEKKVKTYNFEITKDRSRIEISGLKGGLYTYNATSNIQGKNQTSSGQFLVTEQDLESLNTVADFNFLRTLSNDHNGKFFKNSEILEIRNHLKKDNLVDKIISNEDLKDFINLRWLLALLVLLAAAEWIIRKYLGSY
ncbi:VWA domain-containing protein [Lacihabitans lacunae]|uniref:VWA domain-containing protein n=1 Tax=Lacihabitans lacunae TaxID=1028214 RepID=A0ABV7YRC5_9BACT